MTPDAALALRAQAGDAAAFTAIVQRHQASVYALCRRLLGAREGEDAAQETFLRAFVHRQHFDPERPLAPWLLTIARRLCIDRLRRQQLRQQLTSTTSSEEAHDPGPGTESLAAARQEVRVLATHLAALPEPQREALLLFHVHGLAYRDIAEVLQVPVGTVMTWLHRGRAALRAGLYGAGGDA